MHATVSNYLEEDHVRIEMALRRATSSGDRIQPEAYAQFRGALLRQEKLPGADADSVLARLQAAPSVALNPHVDNDTAVESMRAAIRRAGYSFDV